jgi:transcriptional regulator with XRE-family HTH domain
LGLAHRKGAAQEIGSDREIGLSFDVREYASVNQSLDNATSAFGNLDIVVSGAAGRVVAALLRGPAAPHTIMTMVARSPAPPLGPRLLALRKARRMTLDDLAAVSGVSRSMLSQVERGSANPTYGTLWSLTQALGVDLSEVIGEGVSEVHCEPGVEVQAANFTPEIRSEDGRCTLRILSPAHRAGSMEWYELEVEPGGALVSEPHARGSTEHLTVAEGVLTVTAGGANAVVTAGATARYAVDRPHEIRNAGDTRARAFLVVLV